MRRLNLPIAVLAAMILPLGGLMVAEPAMAFNVGTVYKDCEVNGTLTKQYPRAELQAALNALPAQVSEYSACADVIRQALLRASSGGGGTHSNSKTLYSGGGRHGHGGGGGTGSARGHAGKTGTAGIGVTSKGQSAGTGNPGGPVNLAGSNIRPGSTGTAAATSSLPLALIVVLILLALTAVSGGAVAIRRRVVARHGT